MFVNEYMHKSTFLSSNIMVIFYIHAMPGKKERSFYYYFCFEILGIDVFHDDDVLTI